MPTYIAEVSAGFGKTKAAIERVAARANRVHRRYEIYVPTHALAEEWKARLLECNPSLDVQIIYGREFTRGESEPLCRKSTTAKRLSDAGYSVYPNMCRRRDANTQQVLECEYYENCAYVNQFRRSDVTIYTHAYLPLERGLVEMEVPFAVVIDESFWASCVTATSLSIGLLTHPDLPPDARRLVAAIGNALTTNRAQIGPMLRASIDSGEYRKAIAALERLRTVVTPVMAESEVIKLVSHKLSFSGVSALLKHLCLESAYRDSPQSVDFDHETSTITTHQKAPITRFKGSGLRAVLREKLAVVILDASASREIISRFFDVTEHQKIEVKRNTKVIQCISTRCSTVSLVPDRNKNVESSSNAAKRLKGIQVLINQNVESGRRVLVGGPAVITGNSRVGTLPLITHTSEDLAHFNGVRGIDRWKNHDVGIVIGRNQPPVEAVENLARAIFCDDETPLNLTGNWIDEARGYCYANEEIGVMVPVHPDNRVQVIHEQLREHESLQLVSRLRPVHNKKPKTVYLFSNTPLNLDVDELRTWDEIIHGGNRLELACKTHTGSVFPLNPAWLAATFSEIWPTIAAAKQDVRRILKKEQTSNMNTIRKMFPFDYQFKLARQRNWSRCLSRFSDETATAEGLQKLIGAPVTVRLIAPHRRDKESGLESP